MSPIQFNPTNVINFASSLSPIFITTFLVLDGAFNGNIKFLFYLVGLFFAPLEYYPRSSSFYGYR